MIFVLKTQQLYKKQKDDREVYTGVLIFKRKMR